MKDAAVTLVDPALIERNRDNPRLIFHDAEMRALQESIAAQGILVPLTVFRDGKKYRLLDGERRWRSSLKLAMSRVPVIVQPKPERLANIMMMFAIHHARQDWDPLPTAMKLEELEDVFARQHGRTPTERELAGLASMKRGEVRRLKKLLGLPATYRSMLMRELGRPRSEQRITVDQVLEATNAAQALRKRGVVSAQGESALRRAIVDKFRAKVIENTVSPRKLAKLARAVQRGEIPVGAAREVVARLIRVRAYTVDEAFADSVEQFDFEHSLQGLTQRVERLLDTHIERRFRPSAATRDALVQLSARIDRFLRKR